MYEAGMSPAKYFSGFYDENDKKLIVICPRYVDDMLHACVVDYVDLRKLIGENFNVNIWHENNLLWKSKICIALNRVSHHQNMFRW